MTETPSSITCQRCGTRTTWTPYCPGCGAYLEFAGVPPWTPPAPDAPTHETDSADTVDSTDSTDSSSHSPTQDNETHSDATPTTGPTQDGVPDAAHTNADQEAATETSTSDAAGDDTGTLGTDGATGADEPPPPKVRRGNPDPWWKLWARPIIEEPHESAPDESPTQDHALAAAYDEESAGVVLPKDV
ncbi:MAG: hypothetical protein EBY42_05035, partial [Actinobacteria bacterium]|nr:hypothetical protein [Actinomycetota bacterium]